MGGPSRRYSLTRVMLCRNLRRWRPSWRDRMKCSASNSMVLSDRIVITLTTSQLKHQRNNRSPNRRRPKADHRHPVTHVMPLPGVPMRLRILRPMNSSTGSRIRSMTMTTSRTSPTLGQRSQRLPRQSHAPSWHSSSKSNGCRTKSRNGRGRRRRWASQLRVVRQQLRRL